MQIGNFKIPDNPNRLPRLVEHTKKIYDSYQGIIPNAKNHDGLAQLLGYKSSNNGAYWSELAALKSYGLLEGRSDVKVSELGKQATYGLGEQKTKALLQVFLDIPLWKALYDRHRFDLPSGDFWAKLQSITGCEAPTAKSSEKFITEAFNTDASLIKSVKETIGGEIGLTPPSPEPETEATAQFIELKAGSFYQRLPYSREGAELAKGMLDLLSKQFGSKQEPKKKEAKGEG